MLLMVGLLICFGARRVCSYMTKYKLEALLKLQTSNRHIACRIPQDNLLPSSEEKTLEIFHVGEDILFETDSSGRWTFLNSIWYELTGFTVAETIGNSFLDYVHISEYQRNLDLFQILKAQHIEESVYRTRYETSEGNVCLVKVRMRVLVDSQGETIGTSGTLELIDFENQPEYDTSKQNDRLINTNPSYLEALVNIENILQTFDASNKCYTKILSILGLVCKSSRIYIFENYQSKNGDLLTKQKAQWCNKGISPADKKINVNNVNKPIAEILPHIGQILAGGDIACGTLSELSFEEQKFFAKRGVISVLLLPIIVKGEFLGFIELDECVEYKVWRSPEIIFLQAVAGAICMAYENLLMKKSLSETIIRLEEKVNQYTTQLQNEIGIRQSIQKRLEESLSLQKTTLETTADGILLVDSKGCIAGYNHKFVEMWGIPLSLMTSDNYAQVLEFATSQLKNPQEYIICVNQLLAYPGAEIYDLIEFKDGRIFERYSQPRYVGGEIVGRVWSFRDISERFAAEATIQHQASHDLLTNLPNRMQFHRRLLESLIKASQSKTKLAVCFLDLDRFKTINETLGHKIGDKLLQGVAQRLKKCVHPSDTIARWGGDEFTLLLSQINSTQDAARVAKDILKVFETRVFNRQSSFYISALASELLFIFITGKMRKP